MPSVYLKPDLHLAAVGDDLISLDVEAGAYGCLAGLGGAIPAPGPDGRLELALPELAETLLDAGLVTRQPPAQTPPSAPRRPPLPAASAWRAGSVAITAADRRRFAVACLRATPVFWRASFAALIAAARRSRPPGPAAALAACQRDAQAFDQLAPFAPFQGECLFRAFLLLAFLRLEGRDATWVFGVRTYPFRAHCWLQVGDTVLDDAVERICGYVPILAV